jgi:aryl-alcohol dehydrogenase-like predicted oxidoreductase
MAANLPTRPLGPLEVSAQGLGCMSMTDFAYGPADQDEAVATLHRALDLGVTFLDTADVYALTDNDFRRTNPRFDEENFDHNLALVEVVKDVAANHGCTPGQVALAWLSAQGDDVVPIPGTKRRTYLADNVGALSVELTAEDRARLDGLEAAGDRAVDMTFANRDTPTRP